MTLKLKFLLSMFRLFPSLFRNNRTAIYTAIFGDYDVLRQQPVCPGVDYICFTERTDVSSSQWRIQQCRPRYAHPRLSAKWFKTHPDHVLPEYRYTIWIDGSIAIKTESFAEEMIGWLNESGLALFRHPDRDSIFDEARVSSQMPKYFGLPVFDQVAHYQDQGFAGTGLYACGVLARDNGKRRIRELNHAWMHENVRWTYQDQLSLPFLLWKHRICPGVLPYNLWTNHLFVVHSHQSDL